MQLYRLGIEMPWVLLYLHEQAQQLTLQLGNGSHGDTRLVVSIDNLRLGLLPQAPTQHNNHEKRHSRGDAQDSDLGRGQDKSTLRKALRGRAGHRCNLE